MPAARQRNVDSIGRDGPEVTNHPDAAPYISESNAVDNFEDAGFASVQARIARTHENERAGHAGSGQANTAPQKGLRGHHEINPMAPKGNNPTRSAGTNTKPSDIDKLKTAGS